MFGMQSLACSEGEEMTVQELIDELNLVPDKQANIWVPSEAMGWSTEIDVDIDAESTIYLQGREDK